MKTFQIILLTIAALVCKTNGAKNWKEVCKNHTQADCTYAIQGEIAQYAAANVTLKVAATCMKHTNKAACDGEETCHWCEIKTPENSKISLDDYGKGSCHSKVLQEKESKFCEIYIDRLLTLQEEISATTPKLQLPSITDQAECIEASETKEQCDNVKSGTDSKCSYCNIPDIYKFEEKGYCSPKNFADAKQTVDKLNVCEQIDALKAAASGSIRSVLSTSVVFIMLSVLAFFS